ncbi:hypothetical protein [Methylobacterium fujisawaense]
MTVPLLHAHAARTAALLEGMNEQLPGAPRDLPDMMRDPAFRRTIVSSQTALALIATHPDEPVPEMVLLARHAIAQCLGQDRDAGMEQPPTFPQDTTPSGLLDVYGRTLAALFEGANVWRPPTIESFADILVHADVRKRYLAPLAALFVVARCELQSGEALARFAAEALVDIAPPSGGVEDLGL